MASRVMTVAVDNITLAEESDAERVSRNPVRLPRNSSVIEKAREKGWSLVETAILPDSSAAGSYLKRQSSQSVGNGRVVGNGAPLGRRPDPMRSAPQGWVPSLALVPAGHSTNLDVFSLYLSRRLWELSGQYDAVTYDKGSKDIAGGMIDCSGWIEFANLTVYDELSEPLKKLLHAKFRELFNNGAAYLINDWNDKVKGLATGKKLKTEGMLPGVLIGIDYDANDGKYWKDIDHIVQVMYEPISLTPMITQSSATGGGVNVIKLGDWFDRMKDKIGTERMFAVDPYVKARGPIAAYIASFC
jgi:hypothetical protein